MLKPIRIAIVLNGEEFLCQPVTMPFSLEGFPPIDLALYGAEPGGTAGLQINALQDLPVEAFDLVLDAQFLTAGLPDFSPDRVDNLITGPLARFLKGLVCQLQELRQKQEINAGIINRATDAIVTINEDHIIIGYNYGAEQMFGYTREEALGQDLNILIPPPYKEEHRDYVRRYVATGEARLIGKHARLTALRRDGREFPMSISFSVAEIRDNLYFTGIIRDITEYKEMEERVLQTERLAAVGRMAAGVAHEVRNPLSSIKGLALLLKGKFAPDSRESETANLLIQEVERMNRTVSELLSFARPAPLHVQEVLLRELLTDTLRLIASDTENSGIVTRLQMAEDLLPVAGDPDRLNQVFLNLLLNAVQSMAQGGELMASAQNNREEGTVVISIRDIGCGIARENLSQLFYPYFTTKTGGTGIGLAISQKIISDHKGTIRIDSALGQGTTVIVELPAFRGREDSVL